jgi:hypothetical protein
MGELLLSDKLQLHNWQQSQTILCSEEDYGEFIVTFLFSSQVDHISSYEHNTIILVYFSITPNGMAQRQRRDWRDSFSIMRHFWQNALQLRAAEPLSAGAGVGRPKENISRR